MSPTTTAPAKAARRSIAFGPTRSASRPHRGAASAIVIVAGPAVSPAAMVAVPAPRKKVVIIRS